MLVFIGLPGHFEIFIILAIALLLFGSRVPSLARKLGSSITEFKRGLREADTEVKHGAAETGRPGRQESP